MKKALKITLFTIVCIALFQAQFAAVVYAENRETLDTETQPIIEEGGKISIDFIVNAKVFSIETRSGVPAILLSGDERLVNEYTNAYEKNNVMIYPEDVAKYQEIMENIQNMTRTAWNNDQTGSGWFHGGSLCIASTINYTVIDDNTELIGRINSVKVDCSVINSTVIDSISVCMCEQGSDVNHHYVNFTDTQPVSNHGTVNVPSYFPFIVWDTQVLALAGSITRVTVHRGTSAQYTYSFVNNAIEA
ncbi:MAG: hypothetical protein IKX20_02835 [Paludibacteraceae bacterium]|nr:hypothetical protein [Paludibacteraceae bacterium]